MYQADLENVTIANGETASRWVVASDEYSDALSLGLAFEGAQDGGVTFTIEVSKNHDATSPDVQTLHNASGAITLPGANIARQYTEMLPFRAWRILASGAVTGAQAFLLSKQVEGI